MKGVCHRVKEGETISELVSRYQVPSAIRVCDLNGFPRTQNSLEPGSLIVLPGAGETKPHEFYSGSKAIRQDLSKLKGKVTWMWPLEGDCRISSPWGLRVDPFSKGKRGGIGGDKIRRTMHHGIDMAVPTGTPVYASRAGVVIDAGRKRLHGNSVKILHDDNWTTIYSHNSKLLVKEGEEVEQGQLIAHSGSTGRSTGPHVHFEIRRPNQESMNPRRLLPTR
jgi:murein DD-endopeptidase MepM/ murein hydrolase activator NlpD